MWFGRVRNLCGVLLLFALLSGLGCYESEYPLGSADNATVDPAFLGNYTIAQKDSPTVTLIIRNIAGKQYYVEWTDPAQSDKEPLRMIGFLARVKDATFANLRPITADDSVSGKYWLVRVALSDDKSKLTIRQLHDEFFKGKAIDSSATLEKVITDNLDNAAMYDADESLVAGRVPIPPDQKSESHVEAKLGS
jgi:hypothetical protein